MGLETSEMKEMYKVNYSQMVVPTTTTISTTKQTFTRHTTIGKRRHCVVYVVKAQCFCKTTCMKVCSKSTKNVEN